MEQRRINVKRKITVDWESENPVLERNEMGVEILFQSEKLKIKLGDGVSDWATLPYFIDRELSREIANEIIDNFTVESAAYIPVANRFALFGPHKGLKSGKEPAEDDDVVRLIDIGSLNSATDIPAPDKVAKYNNNAGLKSDKIPVESNDVVRYEEFNPHITNNYAHNATATPETNKIAMYNNDAGLKSGKAASESNDVVRFIEYTNELSDINSKISTLNGAYYVLDAYNFGRILSETDPDDIIILNTYAIANTPNAASMADVYDNMVIINEFDNAEYVYNKTEGTWVKYPSGYLTIASNDHLGVVKGTEPPADNTKDSYVQVFLDGSMKTIGDFAEYRKAAGQDIIDSSKLDKQQDVSYAGNAMIIGADGLLTPGAVASEGQNPSLIDNPDFAINQRGLTAYNLATLAWIYAFDRWCYWLDAGSASLNIVTGGIQLTRNSGTGQLSLAQRIESKVDLLPVLTLSVSVEGIVYTYTATENLSSQAIGFNPKTKTFRIIAPGIAPATEIVRLEFDDYAAGETSPVINWVKLEAGPVATQFVKPNPATEMYKCQRYLAPLSTLSEIVVKDSETVLARPFHLRVIPEYGVYNPDGVSFYLKSLDGLTVSEGVLPTSFNCFTLSREGEVRVAIRPLFQSMAGVLNMNITPGINDSIATTGTDKHFLLTAEI
jgi:hypothetical protein